MIMHTTPQRQTAYCCSCTCSSFCCCCWPAPCCYCCCCCCLHLPPLSLCQGLLQRPASGHSRGQQTISAVHFDRSSHYGTTQLASLVKGARYGIKTNSVLGEYDGLKPCRTTRIPLLRSGAPDTMLTAPLASSSQLRSSCSALQQQHQIGFEMSPLGQPHMSHSSSYALQARSCSACTDMHTTAATLLH